MRWCKVLASTDIVIAITVIWIIWIKNGQWHLCVQAWVCSVHTCAYVCSCGCKWRQEAGIGTIPQLLLHFICGNRIPTLNFEFTTSARLAGYKAWDLPVCASQCWDWKSLQPLLPPPGGLVGFSGFDVYKLAFILLYCPLLGFQAVLISQYCPKPRLG